jgi:Holliday junction resolvase RusA-like endonuclease
MIAFTVHGTPAPQGSKRAFIAGGRARVIESSHDRVKSWRQAVVDAALGEDWPTLAGPLAVELVFYMRRPRSHYRTGRNAHLLRDSAPRYPSGKPDLSKLARSTEDALTDAGLWADDAQVTEYTRLAKEWADDHLPGADITVRALDGDGAS